MNLINTQPSLVGRRMYASGICQGCVTLLGSRERASVLPCSAYCTTGWQRWQLPKGFCSVCPSPLCFVISGGVAVPDTEIAGALQGLCFAKLW